MALATYTMFAFSIAINLFELGLFMAKKRGFFGSEGVSKKGTYNLMQSNPSSANSVADSFNVDDDDSEQMDTKQITWFFITDRHTLSPGCIL